MQFVFSRAFARSILFASFIVVLAAKASHALAAPADAVPDYVPPPIIFSSCEENEALECGTLTVPVDYREPRGATTGIVVIRAPATNPDQRIGVLVGNPGGPGSPVSISSSPASMPPSSRSSTRASTS